MSKSAANHHPAGWRAWSALARPLQANRGVHFDLQASVMAGCQCCVLVFWSGLLDVPLPITTPFLRRRRQPSPRLHAAPAPRSAVGLDRHLFHLESLLLHAAASRAHDSCSSARTQSQRHVDGLQNPPPTLLTAAADLCTLHARQLPLEPPPCPRLRPGDAFAA